MQSTSSLTSKSRISAGLMGKSWLLPAEKTMLTVALAAGAIDIVLILYKGSQVDWPGYATILAVVAGLMTMGFFYRLSERSERIGAASISAGLFIFFSLCLSMFNYLLLPLWREPIDLGLNAIDQMFGYSWPAVIEWAGQNPVFNNIVRFAYLSTVPQIAVIIVILGITGRIKELNILIVTVTITATFTIAFWGLFPSLGAKSLYDLPIAMEMLASPVVSTAYGDEMLAMAKEGPGLIRPLEIKGLVAFPSYHIVLAAIAVFAARTVKWVFPVYLALNALILPGIYMHGGHHLVDLPAGLLVAAVGLYVANRVVNNHYRDNKLPEFLPN
ncbi:MAG: phosphatase PAP2 family protein [Rhizobiaceae bacterium]|nr:phosphatase PAP2 family protein [Rhizobiaceae bacterium]